MLQSPVDLDFIIAMNNECGFPTAFPPPLPPRPPCPPPGIGDVSLYNEIRQHVTVVTFPLTSLTAVLHMISVSGAR